MAQLVNSKEEFQNIVLESSAPSVVDFFATWCGPCQMLAPVLDELHEEFKGKANVVKVDSDKSPDLCQEYGIKLLPTLVFFKDGKEVDRIVGVSEKEDIEQKLNNLL